MHCTGLSDYVSVSTSRVPGQHARERIRGLVVRGVLAVALLIGAGALAGTAMGFDSPGFAVVELAVVAALVALDRRALPVIDRWARGATGEERVGKLVDCLVGDGWLALHDISLGRGNVDHVLIGPAGIFTIETKSQRGRVRTGSIRPEWLKQAYAESKLIERVTGRPVEPLLVFSEAYLDRAVSRRKGVLVLPARMLVKNLASRPSQLSREQVAQLHHRLASAL